MPPAARSGAHAEIVLLAIAATERRLVERPDLIKSGAPDIHAEADRRWHLDPASGIGPRHAASIASASGAERERAVRRGPRIAADRGVVGERRDGGYARPGIGLGRQPP